MDPVALSRQIFCHINHQFSFQTINYTITTLMTVFAINEASHSLFLLRCCVKHKHLFTDVSDERTMKISQSKQQQASLISVRSLVNWNSERLNAQEWDDTVTVDWSIWLAGKKNNCEVQRDLRYLHFSVDVQFFSISLWQALLTGMMR